MLVTNLSQLSLPSLHEEDPTEVAYCQIRKPKEGFRFYDNDNDDDKDNVSDGNAFDNDTGPEGICPAYADALYLGEALDKILFRDKNSTEHHGDLIMKLKMRLTEVMPRSEKKTRTQWLNQLGWSMDRDESLYGLDPAEDVDESNWLEKGHYREPRG